MVKETKTPLSKADARKARLATQLRGNLKRRKQQDYADRGGKADQSSGIPAVKKD